MPIPWFGAGFESEDSEEEACGRCRASLAQLNSTAIALSFDRVAGQTGLHRRCPALPPAAGSSGFPRRVESPCPQRPSWRTLLDQAPLGAWKSRTQRSTLRSA
jgi:hypothetical protein